MQPTGTVEEAVREVVDRTVAAIIRCQKRNDVFLEDAARQHLAFLRETHPRVYLAMLNEVVDPERFMRILVDDFVVPAVIGDPSPWDVRPL